MCAWGSNMKKYFLLNKKNRSGLSTIVTTLILIVLSLVAVGVLWSFVNSLINKQINSNEACYGNSDKVKINSQYTCYETVGTNKYNVRFSLSLGDVRVDKVIVSVSYAGTTKIYTITNTLQDLSSQGLSPYPSGTKVILPMKKCWINL